MYQTNYSIEHTSEEIYLENLPIWQELMDLLSKNKLGFFLHKLVGSLHSQILLQSQRP